eukprot:CAMPEP_0183347888 /NCGR_PEP_ID=MMETSP0164_2-20130417/12573_1 /TAXON_ID=221442 /ORGANISM="Coccolithus pelagicus ssp braarudi, Strain PLY182g" /LENGTH=82 /DNA_ID=CAMNT_0025519393 /DNA_START=164 /DNA_END=409 /DNA_ORIENTATION=-
MKTERRELVRAPNENEKEENPEHVDEVDETEPHALGGGGRLKAREVEAEGDVEAPQYFVAGVDVILVEEGEAGKVEADEEGT